MSSLDETPSAVARSLRSALRQRDAELRDGIWPETGWRLAVESGVTGWTIPTVLAGSGFSATAVLDGCIELARGSLSIAFILSQFHAAVARVLDSENDTLQRSWLPALAKGRAFATVGISHLTTSRQHARQAVMSAVPRGAGYELIGETPWITGADQADLLVVGAVTSSGEQLLFGVRAKSAGLTVRPPYALVALGESRTAAVAFDGVAVGPEDRLAGPSSQVLQSKSRSGAGSLTTSALALGHAFHAIDLIGEEAQSRAQLQTVATALATEAAGLRGHLLAAADGTANETWNAESLRAATTSLALRSCQTYMTATKGAGFVQGHRAERLARESLFFLVWSCPQGVAAQLMQELSRCDADL